MKKSFCCLAVVALFTIAIPIYANVAPKAGGQEDVRSQLSAYFNDIARNSPTVLGGLAESPETMDEIQRRIASMSDEELARMQALMAQTPDWRAAPEALASAFPPEVLAQMQRVGADYAARAPQGEEMRDDVRMLVAVLKVMPDETLTELGLDRTMVQSLDATFAELTPLQTAMLQRQAGAIDPWEARSAAAIKQLPPAMKRGAFALAQHGLLTDEDVAELEEFRAEMVDLLERIEQLPPHLRQTLDVEQFREQVRQLTAATPDVLFMIRHNLPPEMIDALAENIALVEQISSLGQNEKEELEEFRGDLASTFRQIEGEALEGESIDELLSQLGPEHLVLLRQGLESMGEWRTTLPAVYNTLGSAELQTRLQSLSGATPDPLAMQSLESFRAQMLGEIEQAQAAAEVDAASADRGRQAVEGASLERLEIMRMAVESLPPGASAAAKIGIGIMATDFNFNCAIDMPSPVPDISLDFICNPIEDALQGVKNGITSTVNSIVSSVRSSLETAISTVQTALTSAINEVSSTVNSIISSISSLANQIWAFVQTVPELAWAAINSALNLLLDIEIRNGVTLRDLVAQGAQHAITSMRTAVGLTGNWWTAVSTFTLPAIPCPPTGFHTPFGPVGQRAASDNYARYHLVIDGIVDIIPDTETSLKVKIPAQLVYMMFDFLGVCLDQAAGAADTAELTTRHDLVLSTFSNLQTFVGLQILGLTSDSSNAADALEALVNQEADETTALVLGESAAIQSQIGNESATIQSVINNESSDIQSLISLQASMLRDELSTSQALNLRLIAERVLKAGVGHEIVSLELLQPYGYLELVRDLVATTIDAMNASNATVGQAQQHYSDGLKAMNLGREKDAFRAFSMAYREATK